MLSETSGSAPVRHLAVASRPFFETPPDGFSDHPLVGSRGLLWVADATNASALGSFARDAAVQVDSVALLGAEQARDLVPVLRATWLAQALFEPDARSIDVHGLLQGYLRGVHRAGGSAEPGEGLISATPTGGGWSVRTDRRVVTAGTIVNAAGGWADDVARRCGIPPIGLVTTKRTAFVFAPPDGIDISGWPLVMDFAGRFYVGPEATQLLASPAEETPVDPHDARADEADVARAVDALAEATTLTVRGVRRAWAGLRTFAPDRVPIVGLDPAHPSFCWAAGQGGYGIKSAPAIAELVAAAVVGTQVDARVTAAGVDPARYAPDRFRSPS
jgi:D-arginine dehydrogenase